MPRRWVFKVSLLTQKLYLHRTASYSSITIPEREAHVRVDLGQRGDLPRGPVVLVHHVLVPLGRVERVVLLGAEAKEDVA